MKKINFVLPYYSPIPGGGLKMMYEYANRLSLEGFDVMVYHPIHLDNFAYPINRPFFLRLLIRFLKYRNNSRPKWMIIDDKVRCKFINSINNKTIRNADAVVGTYWATAYALDKLNSQKGKKFNFIQGYEIWAGSADDVHKSYILKSVNNIVVSDFLSEVVSLHTLEKPLVIYNSVHERFKITRPIDERNPSSIIMLYSTNDKVKGTSIGLKALIEAQKTVSSIVVDLFGVAPKPSGLPEWVNYHQMPENLCELYNRNAIFIAPNINEGWNLPATESMSCGCALICTNIPGHAAYSFDFNSVRVNPNNAEALSKAIVETILNDKSRIELAVNGSEYVKKFKWQLAIDKITNAILQNGTR